MSVGSKPAVGLQTASATAMRWIAVIGFAFREHTTGGLRPPLLYCDADVRRRKNDFCDAQTHIRPGAAGVSPPWCSGNAFAQTQARLFGGLPTVYMRVAVALALIVPTGG
jgi:hypothetical protein